MSAAHDHLGESTLCFTAGRSLHGEPTGYDQNPAVQEEPLRDLITQRGWQLHQVYSDRASGPTSVALGSTPWWPMLTAVPSM